MDHCLLPRCASAPLRVRCFSTGDYDGGPFTSFPARHNWEVSLYNSTLEETFSRGGEAPSVEEAEAFLQTWLYFGTLHEVFGEYVTMSDFIAVDESGNKFLCTGTLRRTMNDWLARSTDRESLYRRVYSHLKQLTTKLTAFSYLPGIEDSRTLTAVALLGETIEDFVGSKGMSLHWGRFHKWIAGHMKSSGWCPSVVTRLAESNNARLSELYYYSHLPAPQGDRNHHNPSCSANSCMYLKIERSTYRTVHTTRSCKCKKLSLNVKFIRESLKEGRLPLIEVAPDGKPCLSPKKDDGSVGFVAISHVWAAGLGNVKRNALPGCSLQEISRLVNELPRGEHQGAVVPFWIDTVCVPVKPRSLKEVALNYLRHPYIKATHVLVLDDYIRGVDSADCDEFEIFARVSCSNWVGRLWTLQEGRLGKRVWFQFRDKAVELKAIREAFETRRLSRGPDYWHLFRMILLKWNMTATSVLNDGDDSKIGMNFHSVHILREAMCFRSVSVPADEALCLFCMAGLDMAIITPVEPSPEARMRVFWSQMQAVPSGLFLSKCPQKLRAPGFRWAPLKFMGVLPRGDTWGGSGDLAQDSVGRPTPRGLLVPFPGYTCEVTWEKVEGPGGFLFCNGGIWFQVIPCEPWHAESPYQPPDGLQHMAVILSESLHDRAMRCGSVVSGGCDWVEESDGVQGTVDLDDVSSGVIGVVVDDDGGTKYVKCVRHMVARVLPPADQVNCFHLGLPPGLALQAVEVPKDQRWCVD
jgi:hypothetical protein